MKKQKGFYRVLRIAKSDYSVDCGHSDSELAEIAAMAANESSAVGSERTLNTAEVTYAASCPNTGFSASIVELNTGAVL